MTTGDPALAKTFVIGAGCQKGGTSWLFQYLRSSDQYVRGMRKEYHVFDALDVPDQAYRRTEIFERAEAALARGRAGGPVNAQVLQLATMYANPDFYFDYFSGLLATSPTARITADITPAYGMLAAQRFIQIREGFAARGVRTVAVFLMRDPVDRILSQIRMHDRERPGHYDQPLPDVLLARHAMPKYAARTRYDLTIAALDEAFGPDEVFYGFYENLFNEQGIRKICELLGIDFHPPKLDERRNASPPAQTVPDATTRTVAENYRGVYEAVAARFPDVDLEALWPSTRLLG